MDISAAELPNSEGLRLCACVPARLLPLPADTISRGHVRLTLTTAEAELFVNLIGEGERAARAWSAVADADIGYSTDLRRLVALRDRLALALELLVQVAPGAKRGAK